MAIVDAVLREFPELNDPQRDAVSCTDGALLVIAGPGSGKTLVLVVRALNILLQGLADPSEILLCTFTEKAAFETSGSPPRLLDRRAPKRRCPDGFSL